MEKAIKHAAETETRVQLLTRVDLNIVSGISRAVKEMLISDVVINWDDKSGGTGDFLFNTLFGSATDNILDSVWETVYVCRLVHPVNANKRIVLLIAKNAEYEIGFANSIRKIATLSRQSGISITAYTSGKTQIAFEKEAKKVRSLPDIRYKSFNDGDSESLVKNISGDDLVVVISARKGTISYSSQFENIHTRLTKQFPDNNFILVYPEQTQVDFLESGMQSQDINLTPIQEQIDNLNKLGKAVRRIFRPAKSGERKDTNGG